MMGGHPAQERHLGRRMGWLRAAVLGANDGIVSVAAIIVGVIAAQSSRSAILTAGIAGLVAGAASMAAGEYVSVSSQADAERADLELERTELRTDPLGERAELAEIYRERGLSARLAAEVAAELSAGNDLLAVHARDELGMTDRSQARPFQAAGASAASFTAGAALPLFAVAVICASPFVHAAVFCVQNSAELESAFKAVIDSIPFLRNKLAGAQVSSAERGALTLTRRLHRVTRGNVALVGDASGSADAITGEGLAMGFRQALLLAESQSVGR